MPDGQVASDAADIFNDGGGREDEHGHGAARDEVAHERITLCYSLEMHFLYIQFYDGNNSFAEMQSLLIVASLLCRAWLAVVFFFSLARHDALQIQTHAVVADTSPPDPSLPLFQCGPLNFIFTRGWPGTVRQVVRQVVVVIQLVVGQKPDHDHG